MQEILDFIKESVNSTIDRLRFPLFNSFLVSWIVFNWKPILLILFSEASLEARIAHVTFHYSDISHVLYYPALTALLYTFLTPMLKRFIGILLTDLNKENRDSQYDYVIDSYTKKNILAAKQYEYQLSKEGAKKVEELSAEIETLKAEKEKLQNDKIQADNTIKEQIQSINDINRHIKEITIERDEVGSMLQQYRQQIMDMEETTSNKQKQISRLEQEAGRTKRELLKLNEERSILLTERDLDREKIKIYRDTLQQIVEGYQNLVDHQVIKIRSLSNSLASSDENESIKSLLEDSRRKSAELWARYKQTMK